MAKQFAEILAPAASEAKARAERKRFIAALKSAAPPKSEFFSKL
jgi:hypothetical protein